MDNKLTGISIKPNSVQISFIYNGVRCRESIRVKNPTKSQLKEIQRKRDVILYEIDMGKFDYMSHFPNSKQGARLTGQEKLHLTIKDIVDNWFKLKQINWEYSTKRGYISKVNNHIEPIFGKIKVCEFKPSMYLEWAATSSLSGKTKNEVHSIMKAAFQLVYNNGDIDENPFNRIERAKHIKQEPDPFNAVEREAILNQMTGMVRNFYEFAFWTGLRTSELLALRREDIDLERQVIFVRHALVHGRIKGTKTKSGERTHELYKFALDALKRQLSMISPSSERVFINPKTLKPWRDDRQIYNQEWCPAIKRSGVKYRKQYNTRHTYASTMFTENKPLGWVAKQLGHSDVTMTSNTYARWIQNT